MYKEIKGMSNKIAIKQIEEVKSTNGDKMANGELVSPAVIAGYSEIMSGAPERILAMTEEQLYHRRWLEKANFWGDFIRSFLGLVFAAILALCLLAGGVLCIMYDHDVAGSTIISSTLIGLVTAFIYVTKTNDTKAK